MINQFIGDYRFLSNFYMRAVTFEGIVYPSNEHAYQAAKTLNLLERKRISELPTPGNAKKAGKLLELRPDWNTAKFDIMYKLCKEKFSSPVMKAQLLGTGDEELMEGNTWWDLVWGVSLISGFSKKLDRYVMEGEGENNLGKILMRIREELKHS